MSSIIPQEETVNEINLLIKKVENETSNQTKGNMYLQISKLFRKISDYNHAFIYIKKAISLLGFSEASFEYGMILGNTKSYFRSEDIKKCIYGRTTVLEEKVLFTCFDEQSLIKNFLEKIKNKNNFFVDIGAGDGLTFSNVYNLINNGYSGILCEIGKSTFFELANVAKLKTNKLTLCNMPVNPNNVNLLLKSFECPKDPDFLTLDIDSYDYYVLEKILEEYSPKLLCVEINELYPPPLKIAQKFNKNPQNKLQGMSISMVYPLLQKHNYSMIHLEYNNVFAVHNDYKWDTTSLNDIEMYNQLLSKNDWIPKFDYNYEMIIKLINSSESERKMILQNVVNDPSSYHFELN